jgi:hypothetical protein
MSTERRTTRQLAAALVAGATLALGLTLAPAAPAEALPAGTEPYAVSRAGSGATTPGLGVGTEYTMNANGRFVAFVTTSGDLGPTDTNGQSDVYLWDRDLGTTTLVSANAIGTDSGDEGSGRPAISANGRFVVFDSEATDLTATPDDNDAYDVFLWDRSTGTTTLVSVETSGSTSGDGASYFPELSLDGSTVAFVTEAADLTAQTDSNNGLDVVRWDRASTTSTLVSVTPGGASGDGSSMQPRLDADGSHIAFVSAARDLVTGIADPLIGNDVFLWTAADGVRLISRDESGTTVGDYTSDSPTINATGNRVAFASFSTNLVGETDTNLERDVFLWRNGTDDLEQVTRNAAGTDSAAGHSSVPQLDAAGTAILYASTAADLGPTDTNGELDVYRWSSASGESSLVSTNAAGTDAGNGPVVHGTAHMSPDGLTVSFASHATDHTADPDTNGEPDAFATDGATTVLLSRSAAGNDSADAGSFGTEVSGDGSAVLFESLASDVDPIVTDANASLDLFLVDGPGSIGFTSASATVDESVGVATTKVVRTGGRSTIAETVFVTADGTATAGDDYADSTGTITFVAGQRSADVSVPIVDDALDEDDETVELTLGAPTGGASLGLDAATMTIVDDDAGAAHPIDAACPTGTVPSGTFPDGGAVHGPAIDCLAWWGLVSGYPNGLFGTGDDMTRGQYATIMVRLLGEIGPLPPTAPDAFADDDGDVHEGSANLLASLGLFAGFPDGTARLWDEVTRAELASMVFRVADGVGLTLPPGEDRFDDVGGVHEEAIERLAAAGLLVGVGPTEYGPDLHATRGQVSSITARFLAVLVEEGLVAVPT